MDCYESADENSEAEAWMGDRKAQIDCECYTCGHLWFIHAEAIDA